jgi:autotransporter translocation and assembly factor TamB
MHAPAVEGALRPIRGIFAFAGKDFRLGDGSVRFTGTEEIDPTLNLSATYSRADFSATVEIRGSALRPSITLSSQPPLPESEIVARVLFDRGMGQLSAIEVAQLADAIASLSGEGAPNILDFARQTLGVDVFRVEGSPDGSEAPTVTVGKYLTGDIYVGVRQGTDPVTGATSVEVQVTPNITLESDVRQDGVSNVGIKWRWDY